ncbi:MAG TPA: MarR family winged helix-turn-helix transcriptional regulator [Mycobacteriales bacterium]|jgi:DNA-binding MarR family transcriptional regulator|nr:MarR family winged helix-turn-helix transcriptional regulator [Mycobacteriales bacterium]
MHPERDSFDGGGALFRLVRCWSRRWAADAADDGGGNTGHVLVLEAIDAPARRGSTLITEVAAELGLDRSNASRMLSSAVSAGLVTKAIAPDDARHTELGITAAGQEVLAAARAWQERTFER